MSHVRSCNLKLSDSFGPASLDGRGWGALHASADIRGDVCCSRFLPLVDRGTAELRLKDLVEALPSPSELSASVVDLSVAVLHFRVSCHWYSERQELLGVGLEFGTGRRFSSEFIDRLMAEDLKGESWSPGTEAPLTFEAFRSCVEQGRGMALRLLEQRNCLVGEALELERLRRHERLETYYEGLKKEQEEEKQSVYFHLYYFEREEKIKKRMERYRREREAALADDKGLFDVNGFVDLVSVGLFQVPVHRFSNGHSCWDVEAVTGTLVSDPS